jgi:hypothetical protein
MVMNLRIETNFISEAKPGLDEIREREPLLFQQPVRLYEQC